ncbi:hypothetical protein F8388_017138 [Cannabis sativa]|uniref:DUF4283 domain-containing protein n=1 Tax=Cannabis sativa TaxID=3483 RepID=A0A7J6GCX8_CANSA|nr:hypothetical protein F8388_017138 [Cannabis sativa]
MADPTLSDLFQDSVQVSTDELTCTLHPGEIDLPQEHSRVLLGKLMCNTRLGRKAIQGSLKNAWSSVKKWSWEDRGEGILQFSFQSSTDADNVLLRRPWLVCGYLLVLMPWPSWLTPSEVNFDHTPIWVRLKSIPPFYWNKTNLQELAAKVSNVYELPKHIEKNFARGSFGMGTMRFRATVDLTKPLFSGFYLRRTGLKDLWIQYQYERLPKICFKCGLLTHEHKLCFKNPTVIKNEEGAFFPMFGTWMDEESRESSPFQSPLPKWFNDWILNQQALKDPKVRNQLLNQRIIQRAESSECRELRIQYPGKRRLVEEVVELRPETKEMVINRYPAVLLPGIGEVTPFENTATGVVEKVLPDPPPLATVTQPSSQAETDKKESSNAVEVENNNGGRPESHKGTYIPASLPEVATNGLNVNTTTEPIPKVAMTSPHAEGQEGQNSNTPRESKGGSSKAHLKTTNSKKPILEMDQQTNTLMGSQAQPLLWPSNECWNRAFNLLTGSNTIDKYHREPTLFNPILNIDDFKCYEAESGPRKRKSTDGFFMLPKGDLTPLLTTGCELTVPNLTIDGEPIGSTSKSSFSPGLEEGSKEKRKRGRPRKEASITVISSTEKRKRGRPANSPTSMGVSPRCFKKKGKGLKNSGQYRNMWNADLIDMAIDLENNFVVVDKSRKLNHNCIIREIEDEEKATKPEEILAENKERGGYFYMVCFQCDNVTVTNVMQPRTAAASHFKLETAKDRFTNYCSNFRSWDLIHTPRACNFIAHNVAKWARLTNTVGSINPMTLETNILDDYVEWSHENG